MLPEGFFGSLHKPDILPDQRGYPVGASVQYDHGPCRKKALCVIVSRCADYILQNKADCMKVFIHADMASRAKRIVEVYGEREQSPEERLRDKDKRRAAYHRFYTNMKWGYAQNYHLTLDSGALGIDKCVEIIYQLF